MVSVVAGLTVKERRGAQRMGLRHCRASVRRCLWAVPVATGPTYEAAVLNLSLGGLTFRGQEHFRPGEYVMIVLHRKGRSEAAKDTLTLRGRVVWCAAPGSGTRETVGVKFVGRAQTLRGRVSAWAARHRQLLS